MKFNNFFNKFKINSICKKLNIKNYTVNDDFSVSVDGDVNMKDSSFSKIPIKFREISGNFYCSRSRLTTLEGLPEVIGGSLYLPLCYYLQSLEFCPKKIGGDFYCSSNNLTSLEGCPEIINGDFDCSVNKLQSLKFCPKEVMGDFDCHSNELNSLEFSPIVVGGDFSCTLNMIESLKGCTDEIGDRST